MFDVRFGILKIKNFNNNMNHPEFSKTENSGFFYVKNTFLTVYALFLAALERRAGDIF